MGGLTWPMAAKAGPQNAAVIAIAPTGTKHHRRMVRQLGCGLISTARPRPHASRLNWALFQLLSRMPANARVATGSPQRRLRSSPSQPRASHHSSSCPMASGQAPRIVTFTNR